MSNEHSKKDLEKGVPDNDVPEAKRGKDVKASDHDGTHKSRWSKRRAKAKNKEIARIQIAERQKRMDDISEMLVEGRSVTEMADITGVSHTTIRNDISELDEIWRENVVGNVEMYKRMFIKRKNYVLLEAKKAFEHSKQDRHKEKHRIKTSSGGEGGPEHEDETIEMTEQRDGDPRFLKIFSNTATDIAEAQGVKTETEREGDTYILPDLPDMVQKFLGGGSNPDAGAVDEEGNKSDDPDGYETVSNAEDADYEEVDEEQDS